tara:strand:+ start:769 stop:1056 length:288 start_codon:yes stop_codon:yes gene_type:complete
MSKKRKKNIQAVKDYCQNELREVQIDHFYFGKNKEGQCQGSIYWVEGAETWCYVCGNKTQWGKCDDLLNNIDDKILLLYYENNKKYINEWVQDQK